MERGAGWGPRLFSSLFKVDPSSALHPFIHLRSTVVFVADCCRFSKLSYRLSFFGFRALFPAALNLDSPRFKFQPPTTSNASKISRGLSEYLSAGFTRTLGFFNSHFRPALLPPRKKRRESQRAETKGESKEITRRVSGRGEGKRSATVNLKFTK